MRCGLQTGLRFARRFPIGATEGRKIGNRGSPVGGCGSVVCRISLPVSLPSW